MYYLLMEISACITLMNFFFFFSFKKKKTTERLWYCNFKHDLTDCKYHRVLKSSEGANRDLLTVEAGQSKRWHLIISSTS